MRNLEVPLCKAHTTLATFKSRWLDARQLHALHLHFSIAAGVGTLTIEESNDPAVAATITVGTNADSTSDTVAKVDSTADATRVTAVGTGLAVNGANSTMVIITYPAAFVRFVYTRTSGGSATGLNCWAQGRD